MRTYTLHSADLCVAESFCNEQNTRKFLWDSVLMWFSGDSAENYVERAKETGFLFKQYEINIPGSLISDMCH